MTTARGPRDAILAAICLLTLAGTASAQYFGQNKVRHRRIAFRVLKTQHFDIYFSESERPAVDIAARMAERWYARLSRVFVHQLYERQPLVLYASQPDFEQTNIVSGQIGDGTAGVTEPIRRRIVLPFAGPLADTDHVIGHELVHAFQFDMTSLLGTFPRGSGLDHLPTWFVEGMAEYCSIGPIDPNTAMWLRDAAREEMLPTIDDLDDPRYFPYRWGQAFWAYVAGRWGDDVIRRLLISASETNVRAAISDVLGVTPRELSAQWHTAIREAYAASVSGSPSPGGNARLVIKGADLGSDLNVGPSISPDARRIAFLSARSSFSIDLYVADTTSRRIIRRLTNTGRSAHFSSLQFVHSAGAWDPAGAHIAIATLTAGKPALAIFDVESGRTAREIPIPTLDEILNPSWAPDGHAICFTGLSHGFTDLYVYDLIRSKLERLTNDPYADLQPAWSPDGRRIAFVTDRFTTQLDTIAIGRYRLALIDPGTGTIEKVPAFPDADNINPQWSPDGHDIYFVSNRQGIPNLYRVTLASGDFSQLTNVGTGVTGVTMSSPAMSIAARSGLASFSVFERGRYDIYTLDVTSQNVGVTPALSTPGGALPPVTRKASPLAGLIDSPTTGLPPPPAPVSEPYEAKLLLEAVGQPSIAVGVGPFGPAVGGAAAFFFSDMMRDRLLTTSFQFTPAVAGTFSLKDAAAQIAYLNMGGRWTWGVAASQIPYLTGGLQVGAGTTAQGEPVEVAQTVFLRQTERSIAGILAYPFSRTTRLELKAGVDQISFDHIVQTTAYSPASGQSATVTSVTPFAPSLLFATSGAAFVFDNATLGPVSPIQGQRYRFEADPTVGTISFATLVADYRRYFAPVPFYTIATRIVHVGRYGGGADDTRLLPLFLGYPTLVRGYDVNTFALGDCASGATSDCAVLDRLIGSRMLVGNVEIRFPLLRPFGLSRRMYGPAPVEIGAFADAGVAWNQGEKPWFAGGSRKGVSSAGAVVRANLRGIAIAEIDCSRPLQRPEKGWVFQFNLTPGF